MTWRMRAALGLGALGLLTSCGGYGSICQAEMDCRGGNSNDVSACGEDYETSEDIASAAHCDGQFNDAYKCFQDHATCHTDSKGNRSFSASGFCNGPETALANCTSLIQHHISY